MIVIDRTPWRPAVRTLGPGEWVAAIGDVHGHADLLAALHDALAAEIAEAAPHTATVVNLGDLVDRGPESRRAVDLARRGVPGARAVTLRGNHEDRLLEELAASGDSATARWLAYGGDSLLAECGVPCAPGWRVRFREAFGPDLIDWLAGRPTSFRLGPLYFVHAGIDPFVDLALQDPRTQMWVRENWWAHPAPYPEHVAVIHGHVPVPAVDLDHPHRLALDTRAHVSGVLSALVVHGALMRLVATRRL